MKKQANHITTYLLPDGTTTTTFNLYIKKWHQLIKPLAKITNSYCFGFNPGLSFCSNQDNRTWKINTDVALMLVAALKNK